jgi:hypothetical protein
MAGFQAPEHGRVRPRENVAQCLNVSNRSSCCGVHLLMAVLLVECTTQRPSGEAAATGFFNPRGSFGTMVPSMYRMNHTTKRTTGDGMLWRSLRLRGGSGQQGSFFSAALPNRRSNAGGMFDGEILAPLLSILLKKALGLALAYALLGIDRWGLLSCCAFFASLHARTRSYPFKTLCSCTTFSTSLFIQERAGTVLAEY